MPTGPATATGSKRRHLGLLRYFTWTSFLIIAFVFGLSGAMVVYVVHSAYVEIEEDEADSLTEAIVVRMEPIGLEQKKWPGNAEAQRIRRELDAKMANFNIREFTLLALDGTVLTRLGPDTDHVDIKWRRGFQAARNGTVATHWQAEDWWHFIFPSTARRNTLETYVPVRHSGEVVAVAEVRRDLAKTLTRTPALLPRFMGLSAIAGLLVFLSLRIVIRRADRTLREQRAEIERINAQLEERNKFLEEYDQRKDEFLSICSHDLRSPLTGVLAGCQLLLKERKGTLNPVQREIVEQSAKNAAAVVRLTEGLLDMARIEAGQEGLSLERFDPAEVVKESLHAHEEQAHSRGVRFELHAPAGAVTLQADRLKVLRVCNNLISNATKHSQHGAVCVRVEPKGSEVLIVVSDCGMGITPEAMALLFDRFSSLARHKRSRSEGTGLGLCITRALVELHGGRIDVTSEEGKGATFTVTLPLVCEAPKKAEPQEQCESGRQ